MTLETTVNKVTYVGNGATTSFSYTFRIDEADDLVVILTDAGVDTELSSTLYSVTGLGEDTGGAVTYPLSGSPIASTVQLTILRRLAVVQDTELTNQSTLYPSVLERALDRLTMLSQQNAEKLTRALVFSIADDLQETVLPDSTTRAGKFLTFDEDGNPSVTASVDPGAISVSAFWETTLALASAALSRAALGIGVTGTLGQAGADTLLGNPSGSIADPTYNSLASYIARLGNTRGMSLRRGTSAWEVLALGSSGKFLGSNGTDVDYFDPPIGEGMYRNLVIDCTSASNIDIDADWVTLANASNNIKFARGVNLSVGTGTSGANGLDTGSIANDTWYSVWVIYNPTSDTVAGLLSLSATAPTLPSGYTFKARFGWVRYATAALRRSKQVNNRAMYVLNATHTTYPDISATSSLTSISISSFIPSTAIEGGFLLSCTTASDYAAIHPNSNPSLATGCLAYFSAASTNLDPARMSVWFPLEATTVWTTAGNGGSVLAIGWVDSV